MGTGAHLIVVGGRAGLADRAARRIARLERLWSRFLPNSEISRLNACAGRRVGVSPDTVELVERALDGWRMSGGAFDPTLLGAVIRAGYDRTFARIPPAAMPGRSSAQTGCAGIETGPDWVRLPAGTGVDPGGIGKGLAADIVADELIAAGADGVCVNLGGDVRVAGTAPEGGAWTVAVEHPWTDTPVVMLGLAGGAVATSTTLRRRWTVAGEPRHHLIDPRTGVSAGGPANLAAAVAGRAWVAEVQAKAVLLGSAWRGSGLPDGVEALRVDASGRVRTTPGLAAYMDAEPPAVLAAREYWVPGTGYSPARER
ncbi:MAG TPA: FAD:protein FMN transferase [Gaiellales bacterium]|jgi:thiamine biosynthesis lipoprotein